MVTRCSAALHTPVSLSYIRHIFQVLNSLREAGVV
jgi:hypothetical protein